MPRLCSTKIVATLGPSTSDAATIRTLFEAGADVFRINFSHGTHDDHRRRYDLVRAVEREVAHPIGVLMDLQGPKLRVGTFAGGSARLEKGAAFRFDLDTAPGDAGRVHLPHPEIFAAVEDGADLLVDDGKLRLRVRAHGADYATCEVVAGGPISDRKGVNVPDVVLPFSPITDKDRRDLAFGLDLGVDWVALSFVQRPDDVAELRRLVQGRAGVLSKIEKPAAVLRLDEIIELSDAVMVARGDLGVEMPPEQVPGIQKRIVRATRRSGKPVIVATQMLDSMVAAPAPTRAEASDVATAVYDGADAVMLSAETASGKFPLEAVTIMEKIIESVEHDPLYRPIMDAAHAEPEHTAADAITAAARQVAETVRAGAIVTYTTSGSTTLRAARERPGVPILCLTERVDTARRMQLAWGVHPVVTADVRSFDEMVDKATRIASEQGLCAKGDRVVITAGVPFGTPGATNVLRLAWVGD